MLVIIASFRIPSASVSTARDLIPAVVAATRAEGGCLAYDLAEDVLEPGLFRVSERWESREALNAHMVAPHMAQWTKARVAMGMSERKVTIYPIEASEEL